MGRVWSGTGWGGFFDIAAVVSSIYEYISGLWPSLVRIQPSFAWDTAAAAGPIGSSPSRWWWRPFDLRIDFSVIDSVLWSVVVAVESVALVSMLCFFFLFCGCNI